MKTKAFRISSLLIAILVCVTLLTSCVSQSYADKINKAAESKKYVTYEEVIKKFGEKNITSDATIELLSSRNGLLTIAEGCKTLDEMNQKLEAGKKVKVLTILIVDGAATTATFEVRQNEEK